MKASEAHLLEFLKKSPQFVIPIYQRTYSWMERECQQLWNDIIRTGSKDDISAHFIGSIVYIEKGLYQVTAQSPMLVIDGQQRLTTITLILEALARKLGDTEPYEGFSKEKLRQYYLLNHLEKEEKEYKLILTQTDKSSLMALLKQRPLPADHSIRIKENFEYFQRKINELGDNLTPLCKGLLKLVIVDISLSRDQDNPQLIFESMNSTGRELSQADLIRNYILMGLDQDHQSNLYQNHWRPMEVEFGQEAYGNHFDKFMRHYLTIRTGEIPNISQVYESFKTYAQSHEVAEGGVDTLVEDIHTLAGYYCRMALGKEPDRALSEAFQDIRELKVEVAYPFLLELYQDYVNDILGQADFVEAVRLVESYVFRRAISNIPTNSLNKTFASIVKALKKDKYLESIKAYFQLLRSYRRFPDDEEFQREIKVRDLYNFPRRSYWLRRLENYGRLELVPVAEYTIEHIMPQNENLSTTWQTDLGPDWKRVHETWLHTLGNLTLTGYNSQYSDRPFAQKRDMSGGFRNSPLRLNEGLGEVEKWNETAILERAEKLSRMVVNVWAAPNLSPEVLDSYRKSVEYPSTYSIDNLDYLSPSRPMRKVFEAFRKEVLALDPTITEEFLKYYVAYKAETNFVDVVPQAGRLRLSLNMAFHEINDPKGLCIDVTHKGRWGNGDAEVGLKSIEELPYILGLVRQAFEKQMGNGDSE